MHCKCSLTPWLLKVLCAYRYDFWFASAFAFKQCCIGFNVVAIFAVTYSFIQLFFLALLYSLRICLRGDIGVCIRRYFPGIQFGFAFDLPSRGNALHCINWCFVFSFWSNSSLLCSIFLVKVVCYCLQVDGSLLACAYTFLCNEEVFGVILKAQFLESFF